MKIISSRIGLGVAVVALAGFMSSLALADMPNRTSDGARPQCAGEHGKNESAADRAAHAAEHFKRSDKNSDGFLTQDEVGERRWSRIQVADANKDGKVTQTELQQAHADGKLGHGKRDKPPA